MGLITPTATSSIKLIMGHSKRTFAQNFQFLTPPPPFLVPVRFTCTPSSSSPPKYVRFSEITPPLLSKKFRDVYEFSNEKSGSEKREKNFFCKLSIKDQCFYVVINIMTIKIFTTS